MPRVPLRPGEGNKDHLTSFGGGPGRFVTLKGNRWIARLVRGDLMIALSNRSRPRWPMQAHCRRRGHVPSVAGIQTRPGPCGGARLLSPPARADRRRAVPPVTSGAGSLSWMLRGACRQADPELFFPIAAMTGLPARQVEVAKAVCGPCAVRANCLSYALEAMPEGIWGGTTPDERSAARRRPARRRPTHSSSTRQARR